jgi:glutathione peroxidase
MIRYIAACFAASLVLAMTTPARAQSTLYDLTAQRIDGANKDLTEFKGKVSLVVNTASECGYTSQYADLQKLYDTYKDRGFVVLGFPSNDFGQQEPGSDQEIQRFCTSKFGVTFPLFAKTRVLGEEKNPIYAFLTKSTGGAEVGWNFEKFLVGKDGLVIERFKSGIGPMSSAMTQAVEAALAK